MSYCALVHYWSSLLLPSSNHFSLNFSISVSCNQPSTMFFFNRKKQNITLNKKSTNGLELGLLVQQDPPPPRILRSITIKDDDPLLEQQQDEQHSNSSDQQRTSSGTNNPQQQTTHDSNKKLEESLPRFGPCYGTDQPSMSDTKEMSLDHVLKKTSPNDPSEAKEIYAAVARKVEQEARETYGDEIKCSASEFRLMMIKDGCFFLQLALLILGSPERLGYPSNNLIFGKKPNRKDAKRWIEAMLFVGNQIPLVVLKELMAQRFFRDVLANGKWDNQEQLSLCKKALYEVLIKSEQGRKRHNQQEGKKNVSDLLHGLHNLVLGPGSQGKNSGIYEFDLEANENSADPFSIAGRRKITASAVHDRRRMFPSATDLNQSGICLKKLKNGGVRNISFRSYYFWATLYLPILPIDDDVEIVFQNLKTYESRQQPEKHKREITSFLRFMSDIVQTSKDVKLLQGSGIIRGSLDDEDEDELPEMLGRLSSEEVLTQDFRILRRQIRDYSGPPWARIKSILNLVAFLTLIQTIFSVLAYLRPPKSK